MKANCTIAYLLTIAAVGSAAGQIIVSPVGDIFHEGRVNEQPTNETVTYIATNPTIFPTSFNLVWDPTAVPNTPMRINNSLTPDFPAFLQPGQSLAFNVSFVAPSAPTQGTHVLQFVSPSSNSISSHTFVFGEVTIPPALDFTSFEATTTGGFLFSIAATVQSSLPFETSVAATSTAPQVSAAQSPLILPPGDDATFLLEVTVPPTQTVGRYSHEVEFYDDATLIGTRMLEYDYGRYPSQDTPVALQDLGTVGSQIQLPYPYCLIDPNNPGPAADQIAVELQLAHTSVQDLEVTLESPFGDIIYLHNRSGGDSDDLRQTYVMGDADGPGDISDLQGLLASGTWTLRVRDVIPGDSGVLEHWALLLPSKGEQCSPRANDLDLDAPIAALTDIQLDLDASRPFEIRIDTLPFGVLLDDLDVISSLPHILTGPLRVVPVQAGLESFQYSVVMLDNGDTATGTVSVRSGDDVPFVYEPLNQDPGWTTEGSWAYGTPTTPEDPNDFFGADMYAYSLDGDYEHDMVPTHLISTPFDFTNISGAQLRFQRWLQIRANPLDNASISASSDGVTWQTIWEHDDRLDLIDRSWQQVTYDLSQFDGEPSVQIRWTMGSTDSSSSRTGWNIDEIEILGLTELCAGDVDGSLAVDLTDLAILLANFGRSDAVRFDGDLDGDNNVGLNDLAELLANFGLAC